MSARARGAIAIVLAAFAYACEVDDEASAVAENAVASTEPIDLPDDLASTGLPAGALAFAPGTSLYSDGFEKQRWIALPDGTIDASNADDWVFPVGTKAWKEFRKGTRKIETRFLWKVRGDRWLSATYVWTPDGATAHRHAGGTIDVDGQPYDVPKATQCNECHNGKKDRLLGFEAVSLAQPSATGVTLATLAAEGRLSPVPEKTTAVVPEALAYLHANCGVSCHNGAPSASARATGLRLRLSFAELARDPSSWEAFTSSVGAFAKTPKWSEEMRVSPGDPNASLVLRLMKQRGEDQMPPLGTAKVDDHGVAIVSAWIASIATLTSARSPSPP